LDRPLELPEQLELARVVDAAAQDVEPDAAAVIAWIESSWLSPAIRRRSSSEAATRCERSSRRAAWSRSISCRLLRSVMSRMKAVARRPSSVSIAESEMSTGNSVPSRRRPASSRSIPIGRVRGSAK
jgi:hypothetical protein